MMRSSHPCHYDTPATPSSNSVAMLSCVSPGAKSLAQKTKRSALSQRSTCIPPPPIPQQICHRAPRQALVGRMLANVLLFAARHSDIWATLLTCNAARTHVIPCSPSHHGSPPTAFVGACDHERPVPDLNGQANARSGRV
jgi:hypothetical protein